MRLGKMKEANDEVILGMERKIEDVKRNEGSKVTNGARVLARKEKDLEEATTR